MNLAKLKVKQAHSKPQIKHFVVLTCSVASPLSGCPSWGEHLSFLTFCHTPGWLHVAASSGWDPGTLQPPAPMTKQAARGPGVDLGRNESFWLRKGLYSLWKWVFLHHRNYDLGSNLLGWLTPTRVRILRDETEQPPIKRHRQATSCHQGSGTEPRQGHGASFQVTHGRVQTRHTWRRTSFYRITKLCF